SGTSPSVATPPTMTTARSTAKARSSRSSRRKIACHGFRSADVAPITKSNIALGVAGSRPRAAPPDRDGRPDGDADDGEEPEPALDPVHVREHPLDLVREHEGEPEAERHAQQGGAGVDREELPERHADDAGREEDRRAESHHVARREHDLHAVV